MSIKAMRYSGVRRTLMRSLVPTLTDTVTGGIRRTMGWASPVERGKMPNLEIRQTFGSSTRVAGLKPGSLLRVSPQRGVGTTGRWNPAATMRFEYVTTDSKDRLITASAVLFLSRASTRRLPGVRPTVAVAPSTQGVATHCNPSYSCAVGLKFFINPPVDAVMAYEQPVINYIVATGANVLVIDYPRDPEIGLQHYCDHQAGARSLADAVRAARHLGLPEDSALGAWGFSQGGGTVGALLEEPEYAPDVPVKAAVLGAPPADLRAVMLRADGGLPSTIIAYAIAGLMVTSPQARDELLSILSPVGLTRILSAIKTCAAGSMASSSHEDTSTWTVGGQTLNASLDSLPAVNAELGRRQLGSKPPTIPYRLWGSRHDDLIPISTVAQLARDWSTPRQDFRINPLRALPGNTGANHFLPYLRHFPGDAEWLIDQLSR